jgi:hypothetical protein
VRNTASARTLAESCCDKDVGSKEGGSAYGDAGAEEKTLQGRAWESHGAW